MAGDNSTKCELKGNLQSRRNDEAVVGKAAGRTLTETSDFLRNVRKIASLSLSFWIRSILCELQAPDTEGLAAGATHSRSVSGTLFCDNLGTP